MNRRIYNSILGQSLILFWLLCVPASHAQTVVQIVGQDGKSPVSSGNPLPTTGSSGSGSVNITQSSANLTAQNPIFAAPGGTTAVNTTSKNTSLSVTAITVALTAPSTVVDILLDPGSSDAYIAFTGTATAANAHIASGGGYHYAGAAISGYSIIATSATGKVNTIAH